MTEKEIEYQILRFLDEKDHEEAIRRIKQAETLGFHHIELYSYEKPIKLDDLSARTSKGNLVFLTSVGPVYMDMQGINIFLNQKTDLIKQQHHWIE